MKLQSVAFVAALAASAVSAAPATPAAMTDEAKAEAQLRASGICCTALSVLLPGKVFSSGDKYTGSLTSYWSLQEQSLTPKCIVIPTTPEDVQTAVFTLGVAAKLSMGNCQFAIRSGGHTPWAGAANIQNGITIDLSTFKQVTVSADKASVSIGPGNRWGEVYSKLDPQGIAIAGGRVATVGVGGLITGGGISFFSPRVGFVCDNVINYQVVLASGQLVNVNANSYPDLYKALKGGSNNFGVVTRFDMKAFSQGKFWGGFLGNFITDREKMFQYFESFTKSSTYDPYSALIMSFSWTPTGGWIAASNLEYTKPVEYPPAFANVTALPQTFNTMRIDTLNSFATELVGSNPAGQRELFVTMSFKNKAAMLSTFYNISDSLTASLPKDTSIQWSISFQPMPQTIISKGAGSNSLGLDASDGDLVNVLLTAIWQDAANDAAVNAAAKSLFDKATAAAKAMGVYNEYKYLNYADRWQDPIGSYGAASKSYLQGVSRKYDPRGLFQKQVPGGFKLGLY